MKAARPVRRGAVGKVPQEGNSLAAYPTQGAVLFLFNIYGEMLTRQPLRFLLADDSGVGKNLEVLLQPQLATCAV